MDTVGFWSRYVDHPQDPHLSLQAETKSPTSQKRKAGSEGISACLSAYLLAPSFRRGLESRKSQALSLHCFCLCCPLPFILVTTST